MGNRPYQNRHLFQSQFDILESGSGFYTLHNRQTKQLFIARQLKYYDQRDAFQLQSLINQKIVNPSPYITRLVAQYNDFKPVYCSENNQFYVLYKQIPKVLYDQINERSTLGKTFQLDQIETVINRNSKAIKYLYDISHYHGSISPLSIVWPYRPNQTVQLIDQWIVPNHRKQSRLQYYRPRSQKDVEQRFLMQANDLYNLGMVAKEMIGVSGGHALLSGQPGYAQIASKIQVLLSPIPLQRMRIYSMVNNIAETNLYQSTILPPQVQIPVSPPITFHQPPVSNVSIAKQVQPVLISHIQPNTHQVSTSLSKPKYSHIQPVQSIPPMPPVTQVQSVPGVQPIQKLFNLGNNQTIKTPHNMSLNIGTSKNQPNINILQANIKNKHSLSRESSTNKFHAPIVPTPTNQIKPGIPSLANNSFKVKPNVSFSNTHAMGINPKVNRYNVGVPSPMNNILIGNNLEMRLPNVSHKPQVPHITINSNMNHLSVSPSVASLKKSLINLPTQPSQTLALPSPREALQKTGRSRSAANFSSSSNPILIGQSMNKSTIIPQININYNNAMIGPQHTLIHSTSFPSLHHQSFQIPGVGPNYNFNQFEHPSVVSNHVAINVASNNAANNFDGLVGKNINFSFSDNIVDNTYSMNQANPSGDQSLFTSPQFFTRIRESSYPYKKQSEISTSYRTVSNQVPNQNIAPTYGNSITNPLQFLQNQLMHSQTQHYFYEQTVSPNLNKVMKTSTTNYDNNHMETSMNRSNLVESPINYVQELNKDRQRGIEKQIEREKQKEELRLRQAQKLKQIQMQRQRQQERRRQIKLQNQRLEKQRLRKKQMEEQRQRQIQLERQKQMQRQKQLERQRQLERQKQIQRQKQLQRQKQKQKQRQRQLQIQKMRQKQKQIQIQRQKQRQKQKLKQEQRIRQIQIQKQAQLQKLRQLQKQKQKFKIKQRYNPNVQQFTETELVKQIDPQLLLDINFMKSAQKNKSRSKQKKNNTLFKSTEIPDPLVGKVETYDIYKQVKTSNIASKNNVGQTSQQFYQKISLSSSIFNTKNDSKYDNKYDNKYENKYDNKYDNRYDNAYDNTYIKYDYKVDPKYEIKYNKPDYEDKYNKVDYNTSYLNSYKSNYGENTSYDTNFKHDGYNYSYSGSYESSNQKYKPDLYEEKDGSKIKAYQDVQVSSKYQHEYQDKYQIKINKYDKSQYDNLTYSDSITNPKYDSIQNISYNLTSSKKVEGPAPAPTSINTNINTNINNINGTVSNSLNSIVTNINNINLVSRETSNKTSTELYPNQIQNSQESTRGKHQTLGNLELYAHSIQNSIGGSDKNEPKVNTNNNNPSFSSSFEAPSNPSTNLNNYGNIQFHANSNTNNINYKQQTHLKTVNQNNKDGHTINSQGIQAVEIKSKGKNYDEGTLLKEEVVVEPQRSSHMKDESINIVIHNQAIDKKEQANAYKQLFSQYSNPKQPVTPIQVTQASQPIPQPSKPDSNSQLNQSSSNSSKATPSRQQTARSNQPFSTIPEVSQRSMSARSDEERDYVIEEYENGSRYEGYKSNGMRNGKGKFYYQEGSFYDGEWKNNNMHGYGKLYYSNNKLAYEGQWFIDQFHGRGRVFNDEPAIIYGFFDYTNFQNLDEKWKYYEGDLVCDSKQGEGKLVLSNQEYYEGQFRNDKVQGKGRFVTKTGEVITGVWQDSKLVVKLDN